MAATVLGVADFLIGAAEQYTSSAFTPAAGDLLVAYVCGVQTRAAGALLSSVAGKTFSRHSSIDFGGSSRGYAFVADDPAAGVSQTVTFDCTGDPGGTNGILVFRVSGMSRFGLSAIRQLVMVQGNTATPTFTLPKTTLTNNVTLTAFGQTVNAAITEPAGWTEIADTAGATTNRRIEGTKRDSGFIGTNITYGSASGATDFAAFAAELDTSSGGGLNLPSGLVDSIQGIGGMASGLWSRLTRMN